MKALKMATTKKPSATRVKRKAKNNQIVLPDLLSAKLGYFLMGLLLVIAVFFSYKWIEKHYQSSDDLMPLRIVEIEGELNRVTRDEVIEQLLKGKVSEVAPSDIKTEIMGFFSSDLALIEQQLESLSWIQKVELRRIWPDKLHIKIKEQRAIAHWNNTHLINQYGDMFKPESFEGLSKLPHLTGPDEELAQLLVTFRDLQKRLESIGLQLSVLNLNHRFSWSLKLKNGITLQVGREHLMERVERFISLYPLLQRESSLPIEKVDLRYDTGLAVTRLETSKMQASL